MSTILNSPKLEFKMFFMVEILTRFVSKSGKLLFFLCPPIWKIPAHVLMYQILGRLPRVKLDFSWIGHGVGPNSVN